MFRRNGHVVRRNRLHNTARPPAAQGFCCGQPQGHVTSTFGDRLRQAIRARGWKQKDLAKGLGVDPSRVSRWVNDEEMPGGGILMRLPGLLRCSGHWLLTNEGEPHAGADGTLDAKAMRHVARLVDAWRAMKAREAMEAGVVAEPSKVPDIHPPVPDGDTHGNGQAGTGTEGP